MDSFDLSPLADLRCQACGAVSSCTQEQAIERLRASGYMKRNAGRNREEVAEMLRSAANRLPCTECGAIGLSVESPQEADADWPQAKRCEGCGATIPAERLEVFPHASFCAACQGKADGGRLPATEEEDYCPRCGSPVVVRLAGTGVARYVRACSNRGCRWQG